MRFGPTSSLCTQTLRSITSFLVFACPIVAAAAVQVVSATYGSNCGAAKDNVKAQLAIACNGKERCDYIVDYQVLGDPAPGCAKSFVAEWSCANGGAQRTVSIAAEAGFQSHLTLACGVPDAAAIAVQPPRVPDAAATVVKPPSVPDAATSVGTNIILNAQIVTSQPVLTDAPIQISWQLKNTSILRSTGTMQVLLDNRTQAVPGIPPQVDLQPQEEIANQFTLPAQPAGAHVVTIHYLRDTGETMIVRITPGGEIVRGPRLTLAGSARIDFVAVEPPPSERQIAEHWAPVISQDVDDANIDADYLTSWDYDGDSLAANNWANLHNFPLGAVVYYWVIETNQRWFIGYGFYHPRDWTSAWAFDQFPPSDVAGVQHINDMEGALISILKAPALRFGQFEAMTTVAHSDYFDFADNNTPADSAWYQDTAPSRSITDTEEDLDFVADDVGLHPVVYMQAEGHGSYGHPLTGQKVEHIFDDYAPVFISNKITNWRGATWSGIRCPPVSGNVSSCYSTSGWGDGVLYHFEGIRDTLAHGTSNWQVAGYDLVSIQNLWENRTNPSIFSSSGEFLPQHANPPWKWAQDGQFFRDPAAYMGGKYGGWSVPVYDPQHPCSYIANSLGAAANACIPQ